LKNEEKKSNEIKKQIEYAFDEGNYLKEMLEHIDSTYTSHYSQNKIQSTEFINDAGHGEGFCIGNIIKYAQRYGKKGGFNRKDLTKIVHYVIIMLYLHDTYYKRN
jgi:hypothetical protein